MVFPASNAKIFNSHAFNFRMGNGNIESQLYFDSEVNDMNLRKGINVEMATLQTVKLSELSDQRKNDIKKIEKFVSHNNLEEFRVGLSNPIDM